MTYIALDPTRWVLDRTDSTFSEEVVKRHHAERYVRGFSRYDWYNFHNYVEYLIINTCVQVNSGDIVVGNAQVKRDVEKVIDLFVRADGFLREADRTLQCLDDGDVAGLMNFTPAANNTFEWNPQPSDRRDAILHSSIASDNAAHALREEGVGVFLKKVFPYLPYSKDRYYTQVTDASVERQHSGIGTADRQVIRSYLSEILIEGISWFASPMGHGYHGESPQWWEGQLHTMTRALRHLQCTGSARAITRNLDDDFHNERKDEYVEGMSNLVKYFFHLWD